MLQVVCALAELRPFAVAVGRKSSHVGENTRVPGLTLRASQLLSACYEVSVGANKQDRCVHYRP